MNIRLRVKGIKDVDILMISSTYGKLFTQFCKNAIISYIRGESLDNIIPISEQDIDLSKEKQITIVIDDNEYKDVCDYLSNIKEGYLGVFIKSVLRYYTLPYMTECFMEDTSYIENAMPQPAVAPVPASVRASVPAKKTFTSFTKKPKVKKETEENILSFKQDVRKKAEVKETKPAEIPDENKISVLHAEPVKTTAEEPREAETAEDDNMDLLAGLGDLFSSVQSQYG